MPATVSGLVLPPQCGHGRSGGFNDLGLWPLAECCFLAVHQETTRSTGGHFMPTHPAGYSPMLLVSAGTQLWVSPVLSLVALIFCPTSSYVYIPNNGFGGVPNYSLGSSQNQRSRAVMPITWSGWHFDSSHGTCTVTVTSAIHTDVVSCHDQHRPGSCQ